MRNIPRLVSRNAIETAMCFRTINAVAPRPADMPIHLSLLKLRLGSLSVTRRLPQLIYEFIIGHYENGIFKRAGDIYAPGREPWPRLSRAEQMRCLHRCRKRHE